MHPYVHKIALAEWIQNALGARKVVIEAMTPLAGGALQRHALLLLSVSGGPWSGNRQWVLRYTGATRIPWGLGRADEFRVMERVFEAGVLCPRPIALCKDPEVIGCRFLLMDYVEGEADGPSLTKAISSIGAADKLIPELGRQLAMLHSISPTFLGGRRPEAPLNDRLEFYALWHERLTLWEPVIDLALQWLRSNWPAPCSPVLVHGDFRTGNFLVADGDLRAILDFEFAGLGDPREDLGWLTMRYWRFGNDRRIVGGLGTLEAFLEGYPVFSGNTLDSSELVWFQVLANVRWALIATMQWQRFARDGEGDLDLALTGHGRPHIMAEILRLIEEGVP